MNAARTIGIGSAATWLRLIRTRSCTAYAAGRKAAFFGDSRSQITSQLGLTESIARIDFASYSRSNYAIRKGGSRRTQRPESQCPSQSLQDSSHYSFTRGSYWPRRGEVVWSLDYTEMRTSWNEGKHLSKEHRRKLSERRGGKTLSMVTREKLSAALHGRPGTKRCSEAAHDRIEGDDLRQHVALLSSSRGARKAAEAQVPAVPGLEPRGLNIPWLLLDGKRIV